RDLMKFCKAMEIPIDMPFGRLPQKLQAWVINGDPDYGIDEEHEWPKAWYGVKGYFRWLESKSYKMHVRVLLSRYRAYSSCPDCQGQRFKPESLLFRLPIPGNSLELPVPNSDAGKRSDSAHTPRLLSLAQLYALPVDQALAVIETIAGARAQKTKDPLTVALGEARARLQYLVEVGLGYL